MIQTFLKNSVFLTIATFAILNSSSSNATELASGLPSSLAPAVSNPPSVHCSYDDDKGAVVCCEPMDGGGNYCWYK